jgi:hypothetical protein
VLPFTQQQFFAVFAGYNLGIWPVQIAAYLLGVVAVVALLHPSRTADRIVAAVLAAMWLWTGIAYHALHFSRINTAAYAFGALFVVQGLMFLSVGTVRGQLRFGLPGGRATWIGMIFLAYAAVVYPLIGVATGHAYPYLPMFGVTPCPVTIFTFGMVLLTTERFPRWLMVIPFIWSLIGGSAALLLAVPQDWLLLMSGLVSVPLIVFRDNGERPSPASH